VSLSLWLNEDSATKYSCLQHRDSSALHSGALTARTGFTYGRNARTVGAQILSTSYLSKYSGQISVLGLLSVYVRTAGAKAWETMQAVPKSGGRYREALTTASGDR